MRGKFRSWQVGIITAVFVALAALPMCPIAVHAGTPWTNRTVDTAAGPVTVNIAGEGAYRVSLSGPIQLPGAGSISGAMANARPLSLASGLVDQSL